MLATLVIVAALLNIIAKNHNYNINIKSRPDFDIRVRRDAKITEDNVPAELLEEIKKICDVLLDPPDENEVNDIKFDNPDFDGTLNEINQNNGEVKDEKYLKPINDFNTILKISNVDLRAKFLVELQNAAKELEGALKSNLKTTALENIRKNIMDTLKTNGFKTKETNEIIDSLLDIIEDKPIDILDHILEDNKKTLQFNREEFGKLKTTLQNLEDNDKMDHVQVTKAQKEVEFVKDTTTTDITKINRLKRDMSNNTVVKYIVNTYNKIYNYFRPNENNNELNDNNSVDKSQAYNIDQAYSDTNNNVVIDETTTETILAGCVTCFNFCPKTHKRLGFICVRKSG